MTQVRRLVYVSGAPGAGKTSLAGPLAADRPVGVGDLIVVDTTRPVDVAAVAARVRELHASQS